MPTSPTTRILFFNVRPQYIVMYRSKYTLFTRYDMVSLD